MSTTHPQNPEAYLDHLDFVRALARSLLRDEHEAEDVAQQAWVATSDHAQAADPRAFLSRVAANLAHNVRRSAVRRQRRERAAAREERVPSTAQIAEREEIRRRVVEAVLELEEPYRSTVLLRYFEDLEPSAIARSLGVPAATIRTRLHRGLEKLRQRLDREHGGDRRGWAVALLPLAGDPRSAAAAGLTATLRWLAVAVAAGAFVVGGLFLFRGEEVPPAERPAVILGQEGDREVAAGPSVDPQRPTAREVVGGGAVSAVPSAAFTGRLLDPRGKPLRAARVVCIAVDLEATWLAGVDPLRQEARSLVTRSVETRTDERGRFRIDGVPPQALYALHLGPETSEPTVRLIERAPAPGETVEIGDLSLLPSGSVSGRVVTRSGQPVAGALVVGVDLPSALLALTPLPDLSGETLAVWPDRGLVLGLQQVLGELLAELPLPRATTAEDGSFELRGLRPGQSALVVQSAEHPTLVRGGIRVSEGEAKHLGDLRLPRSHRMAGVVRDAGGAIVAGAELWLAPLGLVRDVTLARRSTHSDDQGRFVVDALPRATFIVVARRRAGEPWFVSAPTRITEDLELTLPERSPLRVRVRSRSGRPAANVRFKLLQGDARGELAVGGFGVGLRLEGRLTAEGDGGWALRDLDAGYYTLLVQADDHVLAREAFQVPRAEPLEVELADAAALVVRVRDPRGIPVAGASVHVQPVAPLAWQASMLPRYSIIPRWRNSPLFAGRTAADGTLASTPLPAGDAVLTVAHPSHGRHVRKVTLPGEVAVDFPRPGVVAGRVSEAGEPPALGKWLVVIERQRDDSGYLEMPRLARTDPEGRFDASGMVPGQYRIEVQRGFGSVRSPGSMYSWFDRDILELISFANADCSVDAGARAEVVLEALPRVAKPGDGAARVRGRILLDGRPAEGLVPRYGTFFDMRAGPPLDATGHFDLGPLKPGRLELEFEQGRTTLWREIHELRSGEDLDLQIELWTGAVEGVVFGPDGAPVRTRVLATAVDAKGSRLGAGSLVETDARGRFRFERLPEGAWRLHVEDVEVGRGGRTLELTRGRVASNVMIQLRAVYAIAGRVVTDGLVGPNEVLGGGTVVVETEGGEVSGAGAIEEQDGTFRVRGLLPGRYRLRVQFPVESAGQVRRLISREAGSVTVVDRDQSDLVVKPDRG